MFRLPLAATVLLLATAAPAYAADSVALEAAAAALTPGAYVWQDDAALGPVSITVNLAEQRLYVFRGQTLVAATTVSTGRDGKETPVGSYRILQKEEVHHSNLYDAAPMPYMQRLTWDGVAIHAGKNPGFPDSHGCVRVPTAFAKKLFAATKLGATVQVIPGDGSALPPAEATPTADDPLAIDVPADTSAETAAANRAADDGALPQ